MMPEYDYWSDMVIKAADRIEELEKALSGCDDAIREFFRYWYGGEMRGSYDGKPERENLQKAGHAAHCVISKGKSP